MKTDYELMQFVREKGKRIPLLDKKGNPVKDKRGKIVMTREKGNPRGVIVAGLDNETGKVYVGWSYTDTRVDAFNKNRAIEIAVGRMTGHTKNKPSSTIVPHAVKKVLNTTFINRCKEFFSTENVQIGRGIVPINL